MTSVKTEEAIITEILSKSKSQLSHMRYKIFLTNTSLVAFASMLEIKRLVTHIVFNVV